MSDQFINSELLVELSTEEQQLIAGGYIYYPPVGGIYMPYPYPSILGGGISSSASDYRSQSVGVGTFSGLGGAYTSGSRRFRRSSGFSNVGFPLF
ncbi:MAG: hypothetical protein HEQ35_23415 [Gloeotrichia echinulata IR180]|jgi:hypothetical protein|nr:hypothetical protein [Gloeotrichia echinulata DEX184]